VSARIETSDFTAGSFGFGGGLLGLFDVVAVVDDDGGAFAGEADGDRLADAGAGAGDDCYFACETT